MNIYLRESIHYKEINRFYEYQVEAFKTATYSNKGNNLYYVGLGLGEAGEVQGKIKKIMRDYDGHVNDEMKSAIIDELGDTLWYLAGICSELNVDFEQIAKRNLDKLQDRQKRGVIKGSGDYR